MFESTIVILTVFFLILTWLEPSDIDEDHADISSSESDLEDATSTKLLSKKQQVFEAMQCTCIEVVQLIED